MKCVPFCSEFQLSNMTTFSKYISCDFIHYRYFEYRTTKMLVLQKKKSLTFRYILFTKRWSVGTFKCKVIDNSNICVHCKRSMHREGETKKNGKWNKRCNKMRCYHVPAIYNALNFLETFKPIEFIRRWFQLEI